MMFLAFQLSTKQAPTTGTTRNSSRHRIVTAPPGANQAEMFMWFSSRELFPASAPNPTCDSSCRQRKKRPATAKTARPPA